jgi:hypothetical protein
VPCTDPRSGSRGPRAQHAAAFDDGKNPAASAARWNWRRAGRRSDQRLRSGPRSFATAGLPHSLGERPGQRHSARCRPASLSRLSRRTSASCFATPGAMSAADDLAAKTNPLRRCGVGTVRRTRRSAGPARRRLGDAVRGRRRRVRDRPVAAHAPLLRRRPAPPASVRPLGSAHAARGSAKIGRRPGRVVRKGGAGRAVGADRLRRHQHALPWLPVRSRPHRAAARALRVRAAALRLRAALPRRSGAPAGVRCATAPAQVQQFSS